MYNKNSVLKNTLKLTGGSLINYTIPIIITPILSRLYSPEDYGIWGVFSGIVTIIGVVICGNYDLAIVRAKKKSDIYNLILLCMIINFIFCVLISLSIFVSDVLNFDYIKNLEGKWLIPLFLFFTGIIAIYHSYANRIENYAAIAYSQVVSGISQATLRVLFGLIRFNYNGLVVGTTVSLFFTQMYLNWKINMFHDFFKLLSLKRVFELLKLHKKFPIYDAPSTLLIFASKNLPILLLAYKFSKETIGCYTMIMQLLLLPMAFVGTSMSKVYYRQISFVDDSEVLKKETSNILKISFVLGLLPLLFFILGGDFLLIWVLGERWSLSGQYGVFLSLWAFPTILFSPVRSIFRVKNRQDLLMNITILSFIVQTLTLIFTIYHFDNPSIVIFIYSIVCTLFRVYEGNIIIKMCNSNLRNLCSGKIVLLIISLLFVWLFRSYFVLF